MKQLEGDGRRLGPQGGERFGAQPEVLEDLLRHIGLLDAGDELHLALTARTLQDIDAEDPLQQRGPIQAICRWHRLVGVPPTRRIMPFIMPTRNESLVFYDMDIDAKAIDARIAAYRADGTVAASVMHVVAVCAARIFTERPRLNRFVAGGRLWQRRGIWLSFSGKKRKDDSAATVVIKRRLDGDLSDHDILRALDGGVKEVRSDKKNRTDKELDLLLWMPTFVLAMLVKVIRLTDHLGLLPRFYVDGDPLFASMFIANLGSLGMDAAQHHLYEYGNIPLFCVIGQKRHSFSVDDSGAIKATEVYPLRFTFDERIEDGLYCLGALARLKELLQAPLTTPLSAAPSASTSALSTTAT